MCRIYDVVKPFVFMSVCFLAAMAVFAAPDMKTIPAGKHPKELAVDARGNIWVTNDDPDGGVMELSPSGKQLGEFDVENFPGGIAIDGAGDIWVAGSETNIVKLSPSGETLSTISLESETAEQSFEPAGKNPHNIAIDAKGNVWITDYNNNAVHEITPAGIYKYAQKKPVGVAVDANGAVWIAGYFYDFGEVAKLVPSETEFGYVNADVYGFSARHAGGTTAIAPDPSGDLWVTNEHSRNITKLNSSGVVLGTFAMDGAPGGIAIDAAGHVWIADSGSGRVTELSPSGIALATFHAGKNPCGIAIDAAGNVWVANAGSDNVTKIPGAAQGPQFFPYKGPVFPFSF